MKTKLFFWCAFWVVVLCGIVLFFSGLWNFSLPCNITAVRENVSESFLWNNLDFYGIVAVVFSLLSLWYTFRAFVSQSQTENNTRNVPIKDQIAKFCDLNRHEYRNLVAVVSTAVKFFAATNRKNGARASYPSESHILKLQAAPEDFVLDINPEMAATVSEMRLLLRNYNIEITVACDHLTRKAINDEAIEQDYDNLIFKPLFLVKKACDMEAKLFEEKPVCWLKRLLMLKYWKGKTDEQKAEEEKARVKRLLLRSMEIIVNEHLKKLATSLPKMLEVLGKKNSGMAMRQCKWVRPWWEVLGKENGGMAMFGMGMYYLKMISATDVLAMNEFDHAGALKRSFDFLYGDAFVENGESGENKAVTLPWTWKYRQGGVYKAEKIEKALDCIISRLPDLKNVAPEHFEWLETYSAALVRIRNEEQVDFVQFFPLMLKVDVVAELKNIGMVDYE